MQNQTKQATSIAKDTFFYITDELVMVRKDLTRQLIKFSSRKRSMIQQITSSLPEFAKKSNQPEIAIPESGRSQIKFETRSNVELKKWK